MLNTFNKLEKQLRKRSQRRGVAAVEFAVVAPLFILLVFGIIEVGRMLMVQQVLTNASREGARQAVVYSRAPSDVEANVNEYLEKASVRGATVDINPSDLTTVHFGDPVTVSVSVPFERVSWLPSAFYFGDRTLAADTVMRSESP